MDHDNNQYEQHQHTENDNISAGSNSSINEQKSEQPEPRKKKSFAGGIIGGVTGGIIAAVIVAVLFLTSVIPVPGDGDGDHGKAPQTQGDGNTAEVSKTIDSEDADVSSDISQVSDAVVGVINLQQQDIWTDSEEAGTGSGIIYKKENGKAYVVTNQHVVNNASELEVALNDDQRIKAKVLGSDKLTDLAVLEIDGDKIDTVAKLGSSEDVKAGDTVIAIGNPLGMEFANSLTQGIISGLNRSVSIDTNGDNQPDWITEVIQTDAAINPGNSGGALVNTDGEVIGINSMKIAQQAVEGIGFAIPIDSALPIIEDLETDGEVARPIIGISTAPLNQVPPQYRERIQVPEDIEDGMVIADVQADSPAAEAGLQQFDVITKIDDKEVTSILELRKYMYSETEVGDTIKLEYYRDGKAETTELDLAQRDDD